MDSPFCATVEGRLAAYVVAETDAALAFRDQRQAVAGPTRVVPGAPIDTIDTIERSEAGDAMAMATRAAHARQAIHAPSGMNPWRANGEAGGHEVPDFPVHVHPRRYDDGRLCVHPRGLPTHAPADVLDGMATQLRLPLSQ